MASFVHTPLPAQKAFAAQTHVYNRVEEIFPFSKIKIKIKKKNKSLG